MEVDFIDRLKSEAGAPRRKLYAEYRELLEDLPATGEPNAATRQRLAALMEALGLKAEAVKSHLASLADHAAYLSMLKVVVKKREARDAHNPRIIAFTQKRERVMAELDAEGARIMWPASQLETEIAALEERIRWGEGRQEGRHPELYGVIIEAVPQRERTQEECRRENFRQSVHSQFSAVREALKAGMPWKRFDTDIQEVIETAFYCGEANREDFPALGDHPKKAASLRVLSRVEKGKSFYELNKEDLNLFNLAQRVGWTLPPGGLVEEVGEAVSA